MRRENNNQLPLSCVYFIFSYMKSINHDLRLLICMVRKVRKTVVVEDCRYWSAMVSGSKTTTTGTIQPFYLRESTIKPFYLRESPNALFINPKIGRKKNPSQNRIRVSRKKTSDPPIIAKSWLGTKNLSKTLSECAAKNQRHPPTFLPYANPSLEQT